MALLGSRSTTLAGSKAGQARQFYGQQLTTISAGSALVLGARSRRGLLLVPGSASSAYQFEVDDQDMPPGRSEEDVMVRRYLELLEESDVIREVRAHERFERPRDKAKRKNREGIQRRKWERQTGFQPSEYKGPWQQDNYDAISEPFGQYYALQDDGQVDPEQAFDAETETALQAEGGYFLTDDAYASAGGYMHGSGPGSTGCYMQGQGQREQPHFWPQKRKQQQQQQQQRQVSQPNNGSGWQGGDVQQRSVHTLTQHEQHEAFTKVSGSNGNGASGFGMTAAAHQEQWQWQQLPAQQQPQGYPQQLSSWNGQHSGGVTGPTDAGTEQVTAADLMGLGRPLPAPPPPQQQQQQEPRPQQQQQQQQQEAKRANVAEQPPVAQNAATTNRRAASADLEHQQQQQEQQQQQPQLHRRGRRLVQRQSRHIDGGGPSGNGATPSAAGHSAGPY